MAVVLVAGAVAVGYTIAANVALYVVAKQLSSALKPDIPTNETNVHTDQSLSTAAAAPRRIIYGEAVIGGQVVGYKKTKEDRDREYHNFIVHLAGHPCEEVVLHEIEGKPLGQVIAIVSTQFFLGDQTTVPAAIVSNINGWTNDHVGFGQTYAYVKILVTDAFPNGVNSIKFKVKGKKVYDPRKDTTRGGSGSHLFTDPATWEWSENSELIAVDYTRFSGAKSLPERRFDFDFIALAANHCDEIVDYTDNNGDPQTEKRFATNGVLNNAMTPGDGLKEILKSFGAKHYRIGNKMYIKPAMYSGPAINEVKAENSAIGNTIKPHTPEKNKCTVVRAKFIDTLRNYQQTDATPMKAANYSPLDGEHKEEDLTFNLVNRETQAQRLAKYHLLAMQDGFTTQHEEKGMIIGLSAGENIIYTDEELGISKECEISEMSFNSERNTTSMTLVSDNIDMYPDDFNAVEQPITPNSTLPDFIDEAVNSFTATDVYDGTNQVKLEWINPFYKTEVIIRWQRLVDAVTVISTVDERILRENNLFIANYKPGVYLVDLRPLDREGNAGAWITGQTFSTNSNSGFTWRIYADSLDGTGAHLTDDTKAYVGLAFNKETANATASDIASAAAITAAGFTFFKGASAAGAAGKSAYQLWLDEGNVGTLTEFLDSLNGTDGTDGNTWHYVDAATPPSGLGSTGDFALCLGSLVFEKTGASTWTFRKDIVGPDGLQGIPGANAFTLQNTLNCELTPNTVTRVSGGSGWNAGAYTLESHESSSLFAGVESTSHSLMFGISNDDGTDANYNSIDYAIYCNSGTLKVYEMGADRGSFGTYTASDIFSIKNNGVTVKYFKNGVEFYESLAVPSGSYSFDCSIASATGVINRITFSSSGEKGTNGLNGINTRTVELYKTGSAPPTKPTGTFTYTFATDALTGGALDGWSRSRTTPSLGESEYVIAAIASSNTASDTISAAEFSSQIAISNLAEDGEDGFDGEDGLNSATLRLYQKNNSQITAPDDPTGTFTYTFATGALTGGALDGWSTTMPTLAVGEYLWVLQAAAISVSATTSILASNFSSAVVSSANIKGDPGADSPDAVYERVSGAFNWSATSDTTLFELPNLPSGNTYSVAVDIQGGTNATRIIAGEPTPINTKTRLWLEKDGVEIGTPLQDPPSGYERPNSFVFTDAIASAGPGTYRLRGRLETDGSHDDLFGYVTGYLQAEKI